MATPTLATLLTTATQQQAFQALLQIYQAAGFPTTTWQAGDIDLTRMQAFATAIQAYVTNYLPAIAGGTLLDYAPNYPGWTALTAQQIYSLSQNPATYTQGTMTATNTATVPYAFTAGQLTAICNTTGNRYLNTGSGTIPAQVASVAGVLTGIAFQSENPGGSYTDVSNLGNITLVTPLAGVTMSNPAGAYSGGGIPTHVGIGTGVVTPGGVPAGNHSVTLTVTATSTSLPVALSYTLDGGSATSLGLVSSITNLAGLGINIALTNGASAASWVINDTYAFSAPGSWVTSQGASLETDIALANRCRNRFPSLSAVPGIGLYQLLATSTPVVGSQVTQCVVITDALINNKVNIVVSGPAGVLPPATIAAIQAYINPRVPITDYPVVQSPTTLVITIAGTVTIAYAQLAGAQSAITVALNNYVAGVGINGTIRVSAIVELVMLVAGVVDVTGITVNGAASNLTLGGVGSYVLPFYPPVIILAVQTQ